MISRLYSSLSAGVDDILGNIPVLDQLSVAGQNLIAAANQQVSSRTGHISLDTNRSTEAEAEFQAFESNQSSNSNVNINSTSKEADEPFVKPICDIFLEVFELNRGNNWLRGWAVVVILHQLLGGTIERKIRDTARKLTHEDMLLKYLTLIQDSIWPQPLDGGGGATTIRTNTGMTTTTMRTSTDKAHTRTEAGLVLATLIPDLAGSVVGRSNAQAASRKLFAALNNPWLK